MLFWLILILEFIGIGLIILSKIDWDFEKNKFCHFMCQNEDNINFIGTIIAVISFVMLIDMIGIYEFKLIIRK